VHFLSEPASKHALTPSTTHISSPLAIARERRPWRVPNQNVTYVIKESHPNHQGPDPSKQASACLEIFGTLTEAACARFVSAEDGILNEFEMMWQLRILFPLHLVVFKQTACHLTAEANVEQVFSRAGQLSKVNLDPDALDDMVSIMVNKLAYKPSVKDGQVLWDVLRKELGKETSLSFIKIAQSLMY
jgi:hypothetical protein